MLRFPHAHCLRDQVACGIASVVGESGNGEIASCSCGDSWADSWHDSWTDFWRDSWHASAQELAQESPQVQVAISPNLTGYTACYLIPQALRMKESNQDWLWLWL